MTAKTATKSKPKIKPATVLVCYIGKVLQDDILYDAFRDPGGGTRIYRKIKYCIIGHFYKATPAANDRLSINTQPESVDADAKLREARGITPETIDQWEAESAVAKERYRQVQLSKRLDKMPPAFEQAVAAIRPLVKSLTYNETTTLVGRLVNLAKRSTIP